MLLARTAQSVYWAARYLERAEDMARLILVHGDSHLDLPVGQDVGWAPLLAVVGADSTWSRPTTEAEIVEFLLVDAGNPASVLAALRAARDDIRAARVVVPRDAWQSCNDLCRDRSRDSAVVRTREGRVRWLRAVLSACQHLQASLWGSMRRDEALSFARIGQFLERADMTCRLLGARAESVAATGALDPYTEVRSTSVLRALDAYQAFHRAMPAGPTAGSVAAFVLQDDAFPHSVSCCLTEVREESKRLPRHDGLLAACAEALIGLSESNPDGFAAAELRQFARQTGLAVDAIHTELTRTYFEAAFTTAPRTPSPTRSRRSPQELRPGELDKGSSGSQLFEILHTTTYRYAAPATRSYNETHLRPRSTPHQRCADHRLTVTPEPMWCSELFDEFGNGVSTFTVQGSFDILTVVARSTVVVERTKPLPLLPTWESVRALLDRNQHPAFADVGRYRLSSRFVPRARVLSDYAQRSFAPNRPVVEAVLELCERIHGDFDYEPGSTSVTTSVLEVMDERRGVCQDFAHVFVGCVRSVGLAARYVSGYIEAVPAPGGATPVESRASHAWGSVFLPGWGWLDVDPTHDQVVSDSHVTVAWGRDYGDVSPLQGFVEGGGDAHTLEVAVEVHRGTPRA